jgi:hypothetical protein
MAQATDQIELSQPFEKYGAVARSGHCGCQRWSHIFRGEIHRLFMREGNHIDNHIDDEWYVAKLVCHLGAHRSLVRLSVAGLFSCSGTQEVAIPTEKIPPNLRTLGCVLAVRSDLIAPFRLLEDDPFE